MNCTLTFKNLDNNFVQVYPVDGRISEQIDKKIAEMRNVINESTYWGVVSRVDTWKNLAKDLFIPTLAIYALRVNNIVAAIFASFFAIVLDLLTLPLRLITLPFNYSMKLDSPVTKFLQEHANELCEVDYLEVTWKKMDADNNGDTMNFKIFLGQIYPQWVTNSS